MYLKVQGAIDDVRVITGELEDDDYAEVERADCVIFEFRPLEGKFYELNVEEDDDGETDSEWLEVKPT